MKILITGATGFVGKRLTTKLLDLGHEINVLTRDVEKAKNIFKSDKVQAFAWKNNLELPPAEAVDGINGVINLMGENIGAKRWTADQKRKLKESRVDATANLVARLQDKLTDPLEFFISASAVGIYPVNNEGVLTEDSHPGHTFLAELCQAWEAASADLTKAKRKVYIRTAVVLEKSDGALKKMLPPFQMGVGGPIGSGNQMMSWIDVDDLVNLYITAANNTNFTGVYNAAAPHPVSNFEFTKSLGHALHRPTILPVPATALKIAFGEMATVMLDSQAVVSKRLEEQGFHFKYPTINDAFKEIFR
jgi:uncharacterized protein (TIGR01777 family)